MQLCPGPTLLLRVRTLVGELARVEHVKVVDQALLARETLAANATLEGTTVVLETT